ncbi:MAG TPA: arginase family protein [Steroidobacteraceae bacterium]
MSNMDWRRRDIIFGVGAFAAMAAFSHERISREIALVLAPTNLGLRPNETGKPPGTWRAPDAYLSEGLRARLEGGRVVRIARPAYEFDAQSGTRIRNGKSIRRFSIELAGIVHKEIGEGRFPLILGGDCSVLLGAMYGARLSGGEGLVHIDGHSDFFHPGNYDTAARLGSVAGMDLALVTGRGEALLTKWPEMEAPLVMDEDAIQLGERGALDPDFPKYYGDVVRTRITRLIVQDVLKMGIAKAAQAVIERLRERKLDRAWLHLDLDVLDQSVMPAVDSPGSPGLDFAQLGELLQRLLASNKFIGADVAIYDPDRDPASTYLGPIVDTLARAFGGMQR